MTARIIDGKAVAAELSDAETSTFAVTHGAVKRFLVEAPSGVTAMSGLADQAPAGWGFSYMDVMGGWMGSLALMMGLLQARKTGEGLYVDYAVTEGAMSLLGTYMLDFQVNGRKVTVPSFLVKVGDTVQLRPNSKHETRVDDNLNAGRGAVPQWLELDPTGRRGAVRSVPLRDDIQIPVSEQLIVELYSK